MNIDRKFIRERKFQPYDGSFKTQRSWDKIKKEIGYQLSKYGIDEKEYGTGKEWVVQRKGNIARIVFYMPIQIKNLPINYLKIVIDDESTSEFESNVARILIVLIAHSQICRKLVTDYSGQPSDIELLYSFMRYIDMQVLTRKSQTQLASAIFPKLQLQNMTPQKNEHYN